MSGVNFASSEAGDHAAFVGGSVVLDFNRAKRQDELHPSSVDAGNIRERLCARAKEFVQWLFSGRAIVDKRTAHIGSVNGEPGESLCIELSGPKSLTQNGIHDFRLLRVDG